MKIEVKTSGTDVYVNGNLHTFDDSEMSERARILWAIADELGFESANLFEPDDEDFVFEEWF